MINPTPGRIVWYRGADAIVRAAIVAHVNGVFNLNLHVFGINPTDPEQGYKEGVTHADPEQEPSCLSSWHWMPYQKQQAEKHATETKTYSDGTTATGLAPLPGQSPSEQPAADAAQAPHLKRGDFGFALAWLKTGARVARAGWNGKGLFVYLVPANSYPAQTGAAKAFFGEGGMVPYNAYMAVKNVDDTVSTWAPSGSDALAEDWYVIDVTTADTSGLPG